MFLHYYDTGVISDIAVNPITVAIKRLKAFMQTTGDIGVDVELRLERLLSDKYAEDIKDIIVYVERSRSGRNNINKNLGVI